MLIAYILTKSRFLRMKIIRNKETGIFKKGGYEYIIDRKKIYTKRIFGIKLIFWSMYLEGNPNPLEFDEKGYNVQQADVPLDEIAILIHKIIHGLLEIAMAILIVFNMLLTIMVLMKVYNVGG